MSGLASRSSSAARRPSSSLFGGIWTSTTATSGRWARARRRKSSALPVCATTSSPAPSRIRVIPSRRRTSSSPITTRTGIRPTLLPLTGTGEKRAQQAAGKVVLRDEADGADGPGILVGRRVRVARGDHHARRPRQRGGDAGEGDAVSVREADVDQRGLGPQARRGAPGGL